MLGRWEWPLLVSFAERGCDWTQCGVGMCPQVLLFGWHTWCGGSSKSQSSAKFKEISSNLTARGESYRITRKIIKACVQSVLTCEIETRSMNESKSAKFGGEGKDDGETVRWMCGVSLNDRKRLVDLYSLLGVQSVADVVRHDTLRKISVSKSVSCNTDGSLRN